MNKLSFLVDKIQKFSNNIISLYKIKKLAQSMSLEDFTDNNVIFNTSSEDGEISNIKSRINKLIEKLTSNAQVIENVISGKNKNKMDLVEAAHTFKMNFGQLENVLATLDDLDNSYERFMYDEEEGNLDTVGLVDFLENAYNAVNEAISGYTGVSLDQISKLTGEAQQQSLEVLDPGGAGGMQYSSTDSQRQETAKFLKEKLRNARDAEKNVPGYVSPVLQKMRDDQKKYRKELRSDPERWANFKAKIQASYDKLRGNRRANFDILMKKISLKFLKYNLISESEVAKITPLTIHNLLPLLLSKVSDDKEFQEIENLKKQFDTDAELLQFDKRILQQRDDYRSVLQQATKDEDSVLGNIRILNKKIDVIKHARSKEIKENLKELAGELKIKLQKAVDEGNSSVVKSIKDELKNLVENHPLMLEIENDLKSMKASLKHTTNLYPRGALQSGITKVPEENKQFIDQVLALLNETNNEFGSKYNLSESFSRLMNAVNLQK